MLLIFIVFETFLTSTSLDQILIDDLDFPFIFGDYIGDYTFYSFSDIVDYSTDFGFSYSSFLVLF